MMRILNTRFSKTLMLGGMLLLTYFSCKDNGTTSPEEDCKPVSPTDSTSHNFIWRLDTLGEGNGSVLNDVFIINDTLAYAVGEIYLRDSTGQYGSAYNVAKWNGVSWSLQRILVRDFGSITGYFPLKAVFAFSPNDVWFAGDADLIQWNGMSYSSKAFFMTAIPFTGQVLKMWGTSASNLYCVGRTGAIYLYNGSSWQKLNTGTTIDIQDIWGGINCKGEAEILGVASFKQAVPQMKKLLRIQGTTVSTLSDQGLPLALNTIWFRASQRYFIGGDGLFSNTSIGSPWTEEQNIPPYYKESIRGVDLNDIVWAGGVGFISHFNGSSWRHYTGSEVPYIDGNYHSVSIHRRLFIAVGIVGAGRGITLIGKR